MSARDTYIENMKLQLDELTVKLNELEIEAKQAKMRFARSFC